MIAPAIELKHISLAYQGCSVFSDINLSLRAGKWTALLGASGVGKSSLLRIIADLSSSEEAAAGTIIADNDIAVSQQIAWMAQTDMLLPWLTALDNLLLGVRLRGSATDAATTKAQSLLSQAGLAHAENFYPHQLSGGMRQRVALIRTLMEDKPIVLMDEPFSALDTMTRHHIHELAITLLRNKTVFFVTHDPAEALRLADDVYLLTANGIEQLGSLTTPAPRALHEAELIHLQSDIYARLLKTSEVAA